MKKALLSSLLILFTTLAVFAYETIIIKYPEKELWVRAYYKKVGNQAILQLVPNGQNAQNWRRAIFIHSYGEINYALNVFTLNNTSMMERGNPTSKYAYIKYSDNDHILGRCTDKYKNIDAQCEFYRITRAHDKVVSMHYVNKDKRDFLNNYTLWLNVIKNAKYYNSYYRTDRIMDKSEFYEL